MRPPRTPLRQNKNRRIMFSFLTRLRNGKRGFAARIEAKEITKNSLHFIVCDTEHCKQ